MKKIFRKLACCSFLSIASIGCFDAEARVTKEVAEAVLPYLMEVAGVPQAQRTHEHINALINMIYTDEGQQQMVKWAVNDQNPGILTAQFQWPNPSSNIIYNTTDVERIFQLLFPRGPGTFSSYNHHSSRLGRWVLNNNGANLKVICQRLLFPLMKPSVNSEVQIRSNILASMPIDTKLACVLFVLDICDNADQIFNILDEQHSVASITNYVLPAAGVGGTRNANIAIAHNEYSYRPVSATAANSCGKLEGDCVQTLYRHLINIAIQNDIMNLRNFHVEHLSQCLRKYYTARHGEINQGIITVPVTETEAGLTQLIHHQNWHDALLAAVPNGTNITNGSIDNIVAVLSAVSAEIASRETARTYKNAELTPQIPTSDGVNGGTNQQEHAKAIATALNKLDGKCATGNERFIVSVTDNMDATQVIAIRDQLPGETNLVIQIADRLWNRTITIGATQSAHAEIVSIN